MSNNLKMPPGSPEAPPVLFGAGGPMSVCSREICDEYLSEVGHRLKKFDESAASSRKASRAPSPTRSVYGIGGKGARSDWYERDR